MGRDLIGDALIKLPFLRALRNAFPTAEIHWITSQGPTAYASALRKATSSLITQVHEQPAWLATAEKPQTVMAAPWFDLVIDTRNRWREAIFARYIPHGLFLAMAMRFLFSEKHPNFFEPRPVHMVDRLLQMVELVAGYKPPFTGTLAVPDDIMQKAQQILPDGPVYIGLAPGAGNRDKIWPRYKFEKLAELQAAKKYIPVFILGPQELSWYDELSSNIPTAKFPLQDYDIWGTAQLTIDHTLAIAGRLNIAVANDSGVGHMLAAADCRLISLFGPTSPEKLAPRVSRGKIIRASDFGETHMKAIPWEVVDRAVDEMLK